MELPYKAAAVLLLYIMSSSTNCSAWVIISGVFVYSYYVALSLTLFGIEDTLDDGDCQ